MSLEERDRQSEKSSLEKAKATEKVPEGGSWEKWGEEWEEDSPPKVSFRPDCGDVPDTSHHDSPDRPVTDDAGWEAFEDLPTQVSVSPDAGDVYNTYNDNDDSPERPVTDDSGWEAFEDLPPAVIHERTIGLFSSKDSEPDDVIQEAPKSAEAQKEDDSKVRAESLKMAGSFGNFGLFLVIAVVFGYVIGGWCDGFFGTKPWLRVFWVVCAVIASIMEFVKNVKKAQKFGDK